MMCHLYNVNLQYSCSFNTYAVIHIIHYQFIENCIDIQQTHNKCRLWQIIKPCCDGG